MKILYLITVLIVGVASWEMTRHDQCKDQCVNSHNSEEYRQYSSIYGFGNAWMCVCAKSANKRTTENDGDYCKNFCVKKYGEEVAKYTSFFNHNGIWRCVCRATAELHCIIACMPIVLKVGPQISAKVIDGECYYQDYRGVDRPCKL